MVFYMVFSFDWFFVFEFILFIQVCIFSKHSTTFEHILPSVDSFCIKFSFCEISTVKSSMTRILLIEILYKFKNVKRWSSVYL